MFLSSSGDAIFPRLIVWFGGGLARAAVSSSAARLAALGALPLAVVDVHAAYSMKTVAKPSSGSVGLQCRLVE